MFLILLRNEEYQEDLWRRSFEYLQDHLSSETVQKYCPRTETQEQVAATEHIQTKTEVEEERHDQSEGGAASEREADKETLPVE